MTSVIMVHATNADTRRVVRKVSRNVFILDSLSINCSALKRAGSLLYLPEVRNAE